LKCHNSLRHHPARELYTLIHIEKNKAGQVAPILSMMLIIELLPHLTGKTLILPLMERKKLKSGFSSPPQEAIK
jgi:hypothetical protein